MKSKKPTEVQHSNGPQTRSRTKRANSIKNGTVRKRRRDVKSTNLEIQDMLKLLKGAVIEQDIKLVREIFERKPIVNSNRKFEEILWIALEDSQSEIAMILIRAGVSVKKSNVNDSSFPSVLHGAIKIGCGELTRLVIERGANMNAQDMYGDSVLHQAMYFNAAPEIVEELLLCGADVEVRNYSGQNIFEAAAKSTRASEVVMMLVNWGNPDEAKRRSRAMDVLWQLARAPENPDEYLLVNLLSTGVSIIEGLDELQLTLFERAIVEEKLKMVALMVDMVGDMKVSGKLDVHPLFFASKHEDPIIAKLLINKGFDIHAYNEFDQTPLWAACESGANKCIHLLLQLGADINKVDSEGHVAFYYLDHNFKNRLGRQFFIQHIAMLVSQGVKVHMENLDIICHSFTSIRAFMVCMVELKNMMNEMIYNNFSLHSVLSMGIERLTLLMRNEQFVDNLEKRLNRRSCPLYCYLIRQKVNTAQFRQLLVDRTIHHLVKISKNTLPLLVIEKIVCYLLRDMMFSCFVDAL